MSNAPHERAAWGVRAQFLLVGVMSATFGVHVPTVKQHFGLGEQSLAIALLAAGFGSLFALRHAGRVIGRHGPRAIALGAGLASCAMLALLLVLHGYAALLALMAGFGIAMSLFDVAINAEASEIERLAARPMMGGFHGMFSLGGLLGAAAGSALQGAGVAPIEHLVGAALFEAVAISVAAALMLKMQAVPETTHAGGMPKGVLMALGLLAAAGLIPEGAMYDWSVLYLRQELHADASTAALAYASFSGAMAAARFAGDWVRRHVSAVRLVQVSGALGALGMAIALAASRPPLALVGFALVGLGFANVVPVLFIAAAKVPGVTPAHGIASVSAMAWLGMMSGPPLIGVIAQRRSLTEALGVVIVFSCVVALAAGRALRPAPASP